MPELSLHYSPLFLIIFAIVSVSASIFFYRNSPLNSAKKFFLICIKSLSLFLILFIFIQPVLNSFSNNNSKELNIFLIDDSRSCIYSTDTMKTLNLISGLNRGNSGIFTFSVGDNGLKKYNDINKYSGFETNLTSALENIKKLYPGQSYN